MSTPPPSLEAALGGIPGVFREKLIASYTGLKAAYTSRDYDACGLRAGKFTEILVRYLQSVLVGAHTPFGTKINVSDECRALERTSKSAGSESFRILIPRALTFVYTLRNKRDIGHVGGDVDANEIDAAAMARTADWCLSELIRSVHGLSLEEAQEILDAIAMRELPLVWAVAGKRRVLDTTLTKSEQTLVLLYSTPEQAIPAEDLADWVDASRLGNYKSRVLTPLHARRLVEYDRDTQCVSISPTGLQHAERLIGRVGDTV